MKNTLLLFTLLLAFTACQKNDFVTQTDYNEIPEDLKGFEEYLDLPPVFASYERKLPNYLTVMGMVPKIPDNGKATLGRVLFYDKNLSRDNSVACASCHNQKFAFSDTVPVSTGVYGLKGTRNAMPLANVASFSAHYNMATGLNPLLLWDQRAANVAAQSTLAFLNDHELGMTLPEVVERVKEQPYYPLLWRKVYGNFDVNEQQVLECLQEFVGAIGSTNSLFDKALETANGDINATQSPAIVISTYLGDTLTLNNVALPGMDIFMIQGRSIFIANCSKCHSPIRPMQEIFEACNGLDMTYADQGKGKLTGNVADNGVFKAPSLRNIELTAPYMHDGRFATLDEVVEFYSTGVQPNANLDEKLTHNGTNGFHFTNLEKSELIAFLKTFTDKVTTTDERFSNPFKKQ